MSSHRDYAPFELPENMEEDLGLFHAAVQPRCEDMDTSPIRNILAVIDGSHRDATVKQLGQRVANQLGASLTEMHCGDNVTSLLSNTADANLLVVPIPCGEDIEALDGRSLGANADGLLQSCPVPLLCVRDSMESAEIAHCLDSLLVAISRNERPDWHALSWAFRLAGKKIVIMEWVDKDAIADATQLLEGHVEDASLQQSMVNRAVASRLGPLIGAAQRQGTAKNLSVHVEFRFGAPVAETLEACQEFGCGMKVIARTADHHSLNFHLVHDLLLASRRLTLVI